MTAVPAETTPAAELSDRRVVLEVPATVDFVAVVRTLAAGLGARCSLTVDEIDDVRIAVDEAAALLVPLAAPGAPLRAVMTVGDDALTVAVDVEARPGRSLDRSGFGWTVLDALAEVGDVRDDGPTLGLTMTKRAEEAFGL